MKKRRILSFLLIAAMLLVAVPNSVVLAEGQEETDCLETLVENQDAPVENPDAPTENREYAFVYIDENGYFDGDENASEYWCVNENGNLTEASEEDYTMRVRMTAAGVEMTLCNFQFTSNPSEDGISAIWSDTSLIIKLEGTNRITGTKGNALGVEGSLAITGDGTLALESTAGEITDGESSYIPLALLVLGGFTNRSTVTCSSKNPDCTVSLECTVSEIVNTGSLTVGEDQWIVTYDVMCKELVAPKKYNSCEEYPVPTDHAYVAKVYYYNEEVQYPTSVYRTEEGTSDYTFIGQYDEMDRPKGSTVWYQYWYVDSRGAILTEDIVNPTCYLVYDENPETLMQEKDIAAVVDGKTHVFNADLYALWFTNGNVTVNGNVIQDLSCANVGQTELSGSDEYLDYVWENNERVWSVASTPDSSVTVNGNIGMISLNDSYAGNVTVNGNVDLLGFYEDMDPSVTNTLSEVPEYYYGSKANEGRIVSGGEYVNVSPVVEGYKGCSVYNTEDFYVMTERVLNGESVHGTVAAVNGQSLKVDVSKSGIGEDTYPCVKEAEETVVTYVESLLSNKDSELLVLDISLIQNNESKVEPSKEVNLYIGNLEGFSEPAVYHITDTGAIEKLKVKDVRVEATEENSESDWIEVTTNHFSTYFITEDQPLLCEVLDRTQPVDDQQNVDKTDKGNTNTINTVNTTNKTTVNTTTHSVQTGDTSEVGSWVLLLFVSATVVIISAYKKRKIEIEKR